MDNCAILLQMRQQRRALCTERERVAGLHGDNGAQLRDLDLRIEVLDETIGQRARQAELAAQARRERRGFRDHLVQKHA